MCTETRSQTFQLEAGGTKSIVYGRRSIKAHLLNGFKTNPQKECPYEVRTKVQIFRGEHLYIR